MQGTPLRGAHDLKRYDSAAEPMFQNLIDRARSLVKPITLSRPNMDAATVGCSLMAANGEIYDGICIHLSCGIGFCAEAAAISNMIKGGETRISQIVAVSSDSILSPCGRCREMMIQVSKHNADTDVIISTTRTAKLAELHPEHWLNTSES